MPQIEARAAERNAKLLGQIAVAKEVGPGYVTTYAGRGTKIHAAITTVQGHGGYLHPRALCQPHGTAYYHGVSPGAGAVTCLKCAASLMDRGLDPAGTES